MVTYSMNVYILKMAVSPLCIGAEFISYRDLEMRIRRYECENFVVLYIRSSRTCIEEKLRSTGYGLGLGLGVTIPCVLFLRRV